MTNTNQSNCPKCGTAIPGDAPAGLCPQCVLAEAASVSMTTAAGGRNTPPPSVEDIAPHFPELEIIELLGAGGMGAVYKARQPQLDRMVALKILSHDLSSDPAFTERFNREAKVLARLNHPNIVGIFDFGTAGSLCYLLMEYVDGVNLRQAMQAGKFTPAESLATVEDICSALKFAHEEGILHRDIKPENVLIDSKGRVKIADFGIAKLVGENNQADVTLTMQGSVLGSPHYMAPEQIETPGDVDQRADIYSLGVVFYELLTGELPIGRFALPSEKASMDTRIDEIVMRTLEKERQARFQSAEEVMSHVGTIAQSPEAATTAPVVKADNNSVMARFSLTSSLLTGVSLFLVFVSIMVANADVLPRKAEYLIAMLILGLSGCMGLVGLIFGSVALKDIRNSGGEKSGLGLAVFGTVAWPILMIGIISNLFLSMPAPVEPGEPRASLGIFELILISVLPLLLGAFVLSRGLSRWAGGVLTKDGRKVHPKLTRTILAMVGLTFLGPVAAEVAVRFLPASKQDNRFVEMKRDMVREESKFLTGTMTFEDIEWYRGAPEAIIALVIHPDTRADFRLARYDAEGTPEYVEIGSLVGIQESRSTIESFVRIGTSGSAVEGRQAERGFTGLLDFTGQSGSLMGESDFSGWKFDFDPNQKLQLLVPGQYSIQIATR
ncbi:MAG: protein kinase, partial [Akkermansiaceae bacterium]